MGPTYSASFGVTNPDEHSERNTWLRRHAELVCGALDAVPHGFAVLSVEGRVLAANGTLRRWAGDESSLDGRSTPPQEPVLRGFCLSQRGELRGAVARAALGEAVCFETDHLELVPDARGAFSVQASPWTVDGRHLAVCLLIHDVTDEPAGNDRASEMSFRQLFDSVPDALFVVRGAIVLYANRSSCAVLGYDWQDELAGRPLFELVQRRDGASGLPDGDGPIEVAMVQRDGSLAPATMVRSRLMIDDAPTTLLALRPVPPMERVLVEEVQALLRVLNDRLTAARQEIPGASAALDHLDGAESTLRRAMDVLGHPVADGEPVGRDGSTEHERGSRFDSASPTPGRETSPIVLVCDDEARLAMLTAGLLDQYGYGAVTVATGAAALEQLGEGGCDLMLLDMNLPDGSADQVIAQMKERELEIPVIITSGYAEEDVDPKLLADRLVSSYLAKPYSVDRLVGAIQRALDSR